MRRALALVTALAVAGFANAAPVINSKSGSVVDGQVITASGINFGTKATAAPLVFDDLETGAFNSYWSLTHDLSINADHQRYVGSHYNAHLNFTALAHDGSLSGSTDQALVAPKWFVSYWFYLDPDWDWGTTDFSGNNKFLSNMKIIRFWHPSGAATENYVIALQGWLNQLVADLEDQAQVYDQTFFFAGYQAAFSAAGWHHIQVQYGESSGLGAADGYIQFWFDGVDKGSRSTRTQINELANKRPFLIGPQNEWNSTENGGGGTDPSDDAPNDFYMDDVFADPSWARVEIGNNAVYASCTHREMQAPTSWSATSVSFTYRPKAFAVSDPQYLFICDDQGVCSAGFALSSSKTSVCPCR